MKLKTKYLVLLTQLALKYQLLVIQSRKLTLTQNLIKLKNDRLTAKIVAYCLIGVGKLAKDADSNRQLCSAYGIGFDTCIEFSLPDGSVGKSVINFGDEMSSSRHIDKKGKYMFILGKGPTQGLNNTTLTPKIQYSINFARPNIIFFFSLSYNGSNCFFVKKNIPCV